MIIIYLVLPLPTGSSDLPETGRANLSFLLGLASDGVYTALTVTNKTVVSYTTIPPLPVKTGGFFSAALAWESPPPDVIRHPAL